MKKALWGFVVVTLALAVLTLRVIIGGELEIAESSRALVDGDPRAAATHARDAALYYAPGAPHVRVAYQRLLALGRAAEAHHDKPDALFAYRAVMVASASTRWLFVPHGEDARTAAAAVARIESTEPRPPATSLETASVIEQRELEALTRESGPRVPWIVALAVSFVAWVGGALAVVVRGFDGAGHFRWQRAVPGGIALVLGIGVWCSALYLA